MQPNTNVSQLFSQALSRFDARDFPACLALCQRIIFNEPRYDPAHFQMGLVAFDQGDFTTAARHVIDALNLNFTVLRYHKAMAEIHRQLKQFNHAVTAAQHAMKMAPNDADAHYILGLALADAGNMDAAILHYRQALECDPFHDKAANNIGVVLEKQELIPAAEKAYMHAVKLNPANAEAQNNLGSLLSMREALDEARDCFLAALRADPHYTQAHCNLSQLKKYTADDPQLAAMEKLAVQADAMSLESQTSLFFALGKALEDSKRYDDAFAAYDKGNALKRASIDFDDSKASVPIDDIIERYTQNFAIGPDSYNMDETPVFIVGMPRSGTTLIEQIISSHSQVFGAGELKYFGSGVTSVPGIMAGASYMDWLSQATPEDLNRLSAAYLYNIRSLSPDAVRITDKMPGNFFYTGVIHKVFPKARIIHARRHPLDICLSIYSRLFKDTMPFGYNLEELGRHYRDYKRVTDHWDRVLPPGRVLNVVYEDVVADIEGQARRLIAHCGLEWEASCLDFHKNKRLVKTASRAQVRQPIYKSSVAKWEHFREQLAPLRQIIAEVDANL